MNVVEPFTIKSFSITTSPVDLTLNNGTDKSFDLDIIKSPVLLSTPTVKFDIFVPFNFLLNTCKKSPLEFVFVFNSTTFGSILIQSL